MSMCFLFVIVFCLLTIESYAVTYVHSNNPQCILHGTALKCNFHYINDEVILGDISEGRRESPVTMAFIHNVKKLTVSRPPCADLSFYNVESVNFPFNDACSERTVNLRFVDSSANQVPRQLSHLEVTRSKIERVVCNMGTQQVLLTNAQIEEFIAQGPIAGVHTIEVESSSIKMFKILNIGSQMFLTVFNSSLNMPRHSLILGRGSFASFLQSDIMSERDAIVAMDGARLTIQNSTGKILIMVSDTGNDVEYNNNPPSATQGRKIPPLSSTLANAKEGLSCKENRYKNKPTWLWFVPTVFATLEALVIIILCSKLIPEENRVRHVKDFENINHRDNSPQNNFSHKDVHLKYYDEYRGSGSFFKRR